MIDATKTIEQVYRLWGNPSVQELSPQACRDGFEECFNVVQDMTSSISTGMSAAISGTFTLTGTDWTGNLPELEFPGSILSIEFRRSGETATEDVFWTPMTAALPENWKFHQSNNDPAFMFLKNETEWQIKTNFDPTGFDFRAFYLAYDEESDEGEVNLPSFFNDFFKYGMAVNSPIHPVPENLALKERIKAMHPVYMDKYLMYRAKLEQWMRTSRAKKGIGYRTASNAPRTGYGRTRFDWGGTN